MLGRVESRSCLVGVSLAQPSTWTRERPRCGGPVGTRNSRCCRTRLIVSAAITCAPSRARRSQQVVHRPARRGIVHQRSRTRPEHRRRRSRSPARRRGRDAAAVAVRTVIEGLHVEDGVLARLGLRPHGARQLRAMDARPISPAPMELVADFKQRRDAPASQDDRLGPSLSPWCGSSKVRWPTSASTTRPSTSWPPTSCGSCATLARLEAQEDARAVIVTGIGERAFCAGSHIGEFEACAVADRRARCSPKEPHIAGSRIRRCRRTRPATGRPRRRAQLGLQEVRLAVIPGSAGAQRMLRTVGIPRARELILTWCIVEAAEAERVWLVRSRGAPDDALAEARRTTAETATRVPLAAREAKRLIDGGLEVAVDAVVAREPGCLGAGLRQR